MKAHPLEQMQQGKSEFWENIIEERLEEYRIGALYKNFLNPIDYTLRQRRLKRLEAFILRAASILDESLTVDREINDYRSEASEVPTASTLPALNSTILERTEVA